MSLEGLSAGAASTSTDAEATGLLGAGGESPSGAYSWVMTQAMASTALQLKWIIAGAVLLISFEGLAQFMELWSIHSCDVSGGGSNKALVLVSVPLKSCSGSCHHCDADIRHIRGYFRIFTCERCFLATGQNTLFACVLRRPS